MRLLQLCVASFLSLALAIIASAAGAPTFASRLPARGHTGGAVVIVKPWNCDATPLADWLNERGVAVFTVLTPAAASRLEPDATEVAAAIAGIRARAAEFKISARRIALLGFGDEAKTAASVAYHHSAADPSRPDLVALIWGGPATPPVISAGEKLPPTFLVASTHADDNMGATIDLWTQLRAARSSVDAHFFARADLRTMLAQGEESAGTWPELFYNWARFSGLLTDEPRVALKGMVLLDGHPLPHGYVIFTPIDFVGAGPIIGRVFNSTPGAPIGEFVVAAAQGPVAGRYRVDVRHNMNRWLSNSFSGELVGGRGGTLTPEKAHFGHHRVLSPSIDDQRSFTKVRPGDRQDYIVEFKPGAESNLDLKIEVFSK